MAKTIRIPRVVVLLSDQDDPVGYHCDVSLKFTYDGQFTCDANGDKFKPKIHSGSVKAGQVYGPYTSPGEDLDVKWTYTSPSISKAVKGDIQVRKNADCSDN